MFFNNSPLPAPFGYKWVVVKHNDPYSSSAYKLGLWPREYVVNSSGWVVAILGDLAPEMHGPYSCTFERERQLRATSKKVLKKFYVTERRAEVEKRMLGDNKY